MQEHRRVCHINAEQKRRCNIKNGFDMLNMLIPQINQNPNTKMSKAAMLQKGADYIFQLRSERARIYDERQNLQQQVESLNLAIRLEIVCFKLIIIKLNNKFIFGVKVIVKQCYQLQELHFQDNVQQK